MVSDQFHQFLRSRRSVRQFAPDPVPEDVLLRILETASWAPSAHHRQHWRFVVLESQAAKIRLADEMAVDFRRDLAADGFSQEEIETRINRSRERILNVPVSINLCLDPTVGDEYRDTKRGRAEYLMSVQSVALAGLQLLLAVHAEGLAGLWTCGPLFAPDAIHRALDLPAQWQPQALFFIGYPAETPDPRPRKALQEVTLFV
jgi:F420 biosynthesis protein FbiB-like protein